MDFKLTQEQKLVRDMVRKFAAGELEPKAQEADINQQYPEENLKKMGELGLMGMTIPSDYEGSEMDSITSCIVIEEISKICASTAAILIGHTVLATHPIYKYGSEQQKSFYLSQMAKGNILGAFALTEPEAGPGPENIRCTAVPDGENYVLNGKKSFVMNGEHAGLYLLFAREDEKLCCFILERSTHGLLVEKMPYLIGMRAAGLCDVTMENCKIPKNNLIHEDGKKIARGSLDFAKLLIGAQAVGIAQASLDTSIKYSKGRQQFGRSISKFQMIQGILAEMATRSSAARGLVYRAAFERDAGKNFAPEAAMAKWFASETAALSARAAVQIYGGYGYTKDYPVERYMRDAKVTEIYGETSEIQKLAIAQSLLE